MYISGFSINILTLLAIVLATGLVVDDGIVVTENIYKKIEDGMPPLEAAHKGSKEIFFAVVSTSITLAVVFLPIVFLQGFVGRLFREFGIVVAGAVLISAFVSLTLTPMLNVKLARKNHRKSKFYEKTEPFFVALTNGYRNSLASFLKTRWVALLIIAGAVISIAIIAKTIPYLLISLLNLTAILLMSVYLLDLSIKGSVILLFAESTLFIISCLALGLLISVRAESQMSAMMTSQMSLMLPTLLLTGFMFPIENMPWIMQTLSRVVPSRYYYSIVKAIMLEGLGFTAIWRETLVLAFITLLLVFINVRSFKTRLA